MSFGNGPRIVTNGLVLSLDAADQNSYVSGSATWNDLSGNGNNANITSSIGYSNSYLSFVSGSSGSINLPPLNYGSLNFSITCWVYLNSLTTTNSTQGPLLFYNGASGSAAYYGQVTKSGSVAFVTTNGILSQTQVTSTENDVIKAGTWNNILMAKSGSLMQIYVNGINKTAYTGSHPTVASSTTNFLIGGAQL